MFKHTNKILKKTNRITHANYRCFVRYFSSISFKSCKYLILFLITNCLADEPVNNNFLVISDVHLNSHSTHKMQLSPKANSVRNDLDLITYMSFLKLSKQSIDNKIIDNPNFILLLGDLQAHKRYQNDVSKSESTVFSTLSKTFLNTPIIYVFGNNDSPQKNYGKFTYKNTSPFTISESNSSWKNGFLSTGVICSKAYIYPCLKNQNPENGYFKIKLAPKLVLIGLNSVLFSTNNIFQKEALTELSWFEKQLLIAKQNKQQVLIAMHIPPGYNIYNNKPFWRKQEYNLFLKIINKFPKNIIGILSGHTHQEEIKIISTSLSKIGVYSTPSLSTAYGNSPVIKTFLMTKNKQKWKINNYITYMFAEKNKLLSLSKIYDYQNFYCQTKTNDINKCLNNVNITKIHKYMTGGNQNQIGVINAPDQIRIS